MKDHPLLVVLAVGALFPLLCTVPVLQATEPPQFDDEAQATWKQVTWDDFKGRWRQRTRFGREAAYIASGLQLTEWRAATERQSDGTWIARPQGLTGFAYMEKFESSVEPGKKDDYGLAHEQGHFDLTEVVARELRAELLGLEGRGATGGEAAVDLKKKVDAAFTAALQRLEELQERYDGETAHGTKKKVQRRWLEDIPKRLAEAQRKLEAAQTAR